MLALFVWVLYVVIREVIRLPRREADPPIDATTRPEISAKAPHDGA
jgi:hypothetical protein